MRRPAIGVDVPAVRLDRGHRELRTERLEDHGRRSMSGSVGAIESDAHAREVQLEGAPELTDVVVERSFAGTNAADPLGGLLIHQALDLELCVVAGLGAAGVEELDSVVAERVVRGGDDGRQVEAQPAGQHRGGGRRQDSAGHRVPSPGGDPGGERVLEHRARLTRVANDQDLRAVGIRLKRRGTTEPHSEVRREQSAHGPSDPVGPEESPLRHARRTLALRELRLLAGLLQPGLAALLDPRVAGQHAPALELGAKRGIDVDEGLGDSVADSGRLTGDAASVDADADVDVALVAALDERLLGDRLQVGPREVLLERPLVDLDAAVAGTQDHAGDRRLSLPGGEVAGVAREPRGLRRQRRALIVLADQLALAAGALLLLGLLAGALLGVHRPVGLERDRIELGTGDDLFLLLLALGPGGLCRGHLLGGCCSLPGGTVVLRGGVLGERLLSGRLLLGLRLLGGRLLLGLRLLLGGGLLLRGSLALVLRRVRLLVLFVCHQVWMSSVFGCWAWWGCSAPA